MYITNQCNSHCKTCGIWKNTDTEELSVDAIKNVCLSNKDADFVIGGGEAILHSHIEEILQMLMDNHINYTLLSNCISGLRLQELIVKYKVPSVTISCDGVYHDEIRCSSLNRFKIERFISFARRNFVNFKISYTFSKYNANTFLLDMDYFNSLGINKVYLCLAQNLDILTTDKGNDVTADLSILEKRKDMFFDKDWAFVESLLNGTKKPCDSQTSVHTVYSNGNVVRCQSFMCHDIIGNVYDGCGGFCDEPIKCSFDKECNLLCQRRYD